jgi:hypothetical protein
MKRARLYLPVAALALMAFTISEDIKGLPKQPASNLNTPKDIVSLGPNPTTDGTVTISNNDTEVVHVYLFDEESTMLHQLQLKGGGKQVVTALKKGTLTYEVFKNEVSIKQGKIISK